MKGACQTGAVALLSSAGCLVGLAFTADDEWPSLLAYAGVSAAALGTFFSFDPAIGNVRRLIGLTINVGLLVGLAWIVWTYLWSLPG